MRDLDQRPYSADEARIAAFFFERGTGGGDDPVGAILSGYAYLVHERNMLLADKEFLGELFAMAADRRYSSKLIGITVRNRLTQRGSDPITSPSASMETKGYKS